MVSTFGHCPRPTSYQNTPVRSHSFELVPSTSLLLLPPSGHQHSRLFPVRESTATRSEIINFLPSLPVFSFWVFAFDHNLPSTRAQLVYATADTSTHLIIVPLQDRRITDTQPGSPGSLESVHLSSPDTGSLACQFDRIPFPFSLPFLI